MACVRLLVAEMRRSGRDPQTGALPSLDLKDQNQQTPVQLAAEHGHPDCAALLLDADGTGEPCMCLGMHVEGWESMKQGGLATLACWGWRQWAHSMFRCAASSKHWAACLTSAPP